MSFNDEITSPSHLSLREFSTTYQCCPTEETQKHNSSHKSNKTISLTSLTANENSIKNPLQKELSQFLNLLQKAEPEKNEKTTLPVIFSTEESCISDNNELFIKKLDGDIDNVDKKLRRLKEKTNGNKEKDWENALLKEKILLLEKKNNFLIKAKGYELKNQNSVAKTYNLETFTKLIEDFSVKFEKIAQDLRFLYMKTNNIYKKSVSFI